jgi:hypothetical protein
MKHRIGKLALALLSSVALASCTQEGDTYAPEFPEGTGQPVGAANVQYAPGPFGVGVGSTINNYTFLGFPNPGVDDEGLETMRMSDLYNPTGEGVFPADSLYRPGEPLPKGVVIANSAGWCYPCMVEAATVMDPVYDDYLEQGGDFMVALEEGIDYEPADEEDLWDWVNATNFPAGLGISSDWKVRWPAFNNPTGTLWPIIGEGAFPAAIVLRTRDMKIVHVEIGAGASSVFEILDAVLDDEPILAGD